MLSIEDIYHEIGKNIFICPLDIDNFRDNSIDLTASEFAWTSDGKHIYDSVTDRIIVPPHKTACILTRESIYVTGKIGGTYHSRVSLVQKGFGHIGTMLDPKYCGQSLIMLHNITDQELSIDGITQSKSGARIVSLVFYYVRTPIYENSLSTPPSHQEKISKIDQNNLYKNWSDENQWANNPRNLKIHFKELYEKDFRAKKRLYAQKKNVFIRFYKSKVGRLIIKYAVLLIMGVVAYFLITRFFKPSNMSDWAPIITAVVIGVAGIIMSDINIT